MLTRLTVRSFSIVLVVLAFLLLLLQPTTHIAALDAPSALNWVNNLATGHDYAVLADCAGWHACEEAAVAEGAHLVTVNNAEEQAWLVHQFGGADHYWIGLSDAAVIDDWVWTSGEALTYTHWHVGEPSHSGGTEHYVLMNWAAEGEWNDGHNLASTIAIIEKPSAALPTETSTATSTLMTRPTSTTAPTPTNHPTGLPQFDAHVYLVVVYRLDQGYLPGN